jgi:hypothetical protein
MKTINTSMKRITYAALFSLAAMLLLMTGCKEDTAASLYDPNYVSGARPDLATVTSSTAGGIFFSGISTITINGTNFSPTATDNLVHFDLVAATVLQASPTQLVVKAPILVKDTVAVYVAVKGAAQFSDTVFVKMQAAVVDYGNFGSTEEAVGIATDAAGNLYASMKIAGAGAGIRKYIVGPDTGFTFAPSGGVTSWSSLKIGPGGVLFAARVQRALYTIPQNGAPVLWAQAAGSSLTDIDFDNLGNLWAVGNNTAIYRFKVSDKSVTTFPFTGLLRCVRVYNGFVYVAGKVDSSEGVWRSPLAADGTIGTPTLYFNLSALPGYGYNGPSVNAITFNTDGEMYVGTTSADGILLVAPGGASSAPYYTGLFKPTTVAFAWGKGATLFAVRGIDATVKSIVKINTLKTGAPYYGQQ